MLSIANEVDPLIFPLHMYLSNKWYQNGLQFRICITCFMSFGIRDNSFMMLEDYIYIYIYSASMLKLWFDEN